MKTPLKILEKKSNQDLLDLSFSFPEADQEIFKAQIAHFWTAFNERNSRVDNHTAALTQHLQSATSRLALLTPYMNEKRKLVDALSGEINSFINLHEKEQKKSLIEIPVKIKYEIQEALKSYNQYALLLKEAYKFEHLYLKEMHDSFKKIKSSVASVFERYELMANKISGLNDVYKASMRICFGTKLEIEECAIKGHKDFKQVQFNSSLMDFVTTCLQQVVSEEFKQLDEKAQKEFNSFIFSTDFLSNFKNQDVSVEEYISAYQAGVKTQQEFLETSDYRESSYSKSNFLMSKSQVLDGELLRLWKDFSSHYEKLMQALMDEPALVTKIKKQILTLSLKDFFALERAQVLAQALSDVAVEDFSSRYPFLTWKLFAKENTKFSDNFKNTFCQKYAEKFKLEQLQKGVFFQENNGEYQLTFLTFDSEEMDALNLFTKKIETKYQKAYLQVKSVKCQKLSDMLDITQNGQKIIMPLQYHFFTFRDPGLLQNIKSLLVA